MDNQYSAEYYLVEKSIGGVGGEWLALSPKRTGCVEKCTSRVRRVLVRTRARSVESAESMGGMVD